MTIKLGPPFHKPFRLVLHGDPEQEWILPFKRGPQSDTWKHYNNHVEMIIEVAMKNRLMELRFGEHQLYFLEYRHIWGYFVSEVPEPDIPLLFAEWKSVWENAGFETTTWIRIK